MEKDQFEQLLEVVARSGVSYTIHEHAPARTMADAEQNLSFEIGRIVKKESGHATICRAHLPSASVSRNRRIIRSMNG
jgi:hypothetical protein